MLRKIALAIALAAIIVAPVTLYAYSSWIPSSVDADMAAATILGRAVDLSGLLALSFIAVAVLLTVRFRTLTRSVPHPELRATHRFFGLLAMTISLAHVGLLFVRNPQDTLARMDVLHDAPPAGVAGALAVLALFLLAATSRLSAPSRSTTNKTSFYRWRKCRTLRVRHPDAWRVLHLLLAMCAAAGAAAHVYFLQHMIGATTYRWLFLILGEGTAVALLFRYVVPLVRTSNAYTVEDIQHPSSSVLTLSLAPPDHVDIPRFRAGQFAYLRLGRAPWSQERPFTISSSHHNPGCWEFTIRVSNKPGSFSRKLKDLEPGSKIFVDGPHGTLGAPVTDPLTIPFQKRPEKTFESVPGMIGITQGVGITPCLSLLRTLADRHDTRAHSLLVAVRSKDDLLTFRREVELLTTNLSLRLRFAVLSPAEEFFSDTVRADDLLDFLPAQGEREAYEYVLCGPTAFVTNLYTQLLHIGVPRRKIHTETILSAGPAPLVPPPLLPAGHPSAPMREVRNVEPPTPHRPVDTETGDLHRAIRSLHVVRGGGHR